MFERELKINFKSFLIWTSIIILLFLAVFLVYPSIISSDNIEMLDEMMKVFPEEILIAFNMDLSSMDTVFGWLKSEGFIFVLLLTGLYSAILGSNILLKEENDKTIEYLNSLPIKRRTILFHKIICGLLYVISLIIIIGLFNYIGLELSGDFDRKQYILLSITPLLSALPLFAISLFISTFFNKTKKAFGVGLGFAFGSYILQILSEMNEVTEFFKYFTVYTLSDVRNVIGNSSINPIYIVLSLLITLVFLTFTFKRYESKELN